MLKRGQLVALALGVSVLLAACGQDEAPSQAEGGQERPPHAVEVSEVQRQDIALERSYPSLLRSDDEVNLVARITGVLQERLFEPGQLVAKDQPLYTIEPNVYQATVNQRDADLQSARAELSRAQRDAERFERLLSQNSVSRQQYDQALADMRVARARVAQAEAALESSRIDLDYSNVTAPVSGMISLSKINVGNLVNPGTELATITPLDPLEVRFQLPQRDAFELRRQLDNEAQLSDITALLEVPGASSDMRLEGQLDYLGSRVDEATSTVQANATFANPEAEVLPGQFVRVRIEGLKRYDVLAVPEIAITQGLMGPQVFVLDDENAARARTIELGEVAGAWQIIASGLDEGERVVVGDPAGIEPGRKIDPQPFDGDAAALIPDAEEAEQKAQERSQEQSQGQTQGQSQEQATEESAAPTGADEEGES